MAEVTIATTLLEVVALEKIDDSPLYLTAIAQTNKEPITSATFIIPRGEVEIGDLVQFYITKKES